MARYFFDVTDIARYLSRERTISGIQRAATMIIHQIPAVLEAQDIFLTYLDDRSGKQLVLPAQPFLDLDHFDTTALCEALSIRPARNVSGTGNDFLYRYRNKPLKRAFHRLRFDFEAARDNEAYFERRNLTLEQWREARGTSRKPVKPIKPVTDTLEDQIRPGDVICVLGAFWGDNALEDQLMNHKANGVDIYMLVHDMIPLLLPEMAGVGPGVFHDWLSKSLTYCSGYFANSQNTARDLQAFLDENGSSLPIHVTPLAQSSLSEIDQPAPTGPYDLDRARDIFGCRPDVREVLKAPYVLAVGTLEARKNCWRQAQAWHRLSQQTDIDLPRLVFAGKKGWLNDDFLQAYKATGGWGGWVRIIEQPSDRDLRLLYERCEFTLYASLYEGWGLPIGEGLSYGKTGVASATSSMPEVGGDMVEYCDPASISSIADACARLVRDPGRKAALEQTIADTPLRQWSDVSRDIGIILRDARQNVTQVVTQTSTSAPALGTPAQKAG